VPVDDNLNVSPFGAHGAAGNVWEWTATGWKEREFGDEVSSPAGEDLISWRGGSFYVDRDRVRCTFRFRYIAWYGFRGIGFRCVRDVG